MDSNLQFLNSFLKTSCDLFNKLNPIDDLIFFGAGPSEVVNLSMSSLKTWKNLDLYQKIGRHVG